VKIGPYTFHNNLVLAPMAGVTDQVFRRLCRGLGAGLTVCEMTSANPLLQGSRKSRLRLNHDGEPAPVVVQIVGNEPSVMAAAACYNVAAGAHIIDINMGCPAKKVCRKAAGSALMSDPLLVARILTAVVGAVPVPVTLKMRTGPEPGHRNGVEIARIAEQCGVQAVAVHGRTRACGFTGNAEFDTIAAIKQRLDIPVLANGDIGSPEDALWVLNHTAADGLLIGRAAQGNPWIFREIETFLASGKHHPPPTAHELADTVLGHLRALHAFYGQTQGVRVARKHLCWYLGRMDPAGRLRPGLMRVDTAKAQVSAVKDFFSSTSEFDWAA